LRNGVNNQGWKAKVSGVRLGPEAQHYLLEALNYTIEQGGVGDIFQGCFFLYSAKGTKTFTRFTDNGFNDPAKTIHGALDQDQALARLFNGINSTHPNVFAVYVDAAIEMVIPGHVTMLRTASHATLLSSLLGYDTGYAHTLISRATGLNRTSAYQIDYHTTSMGVSGFRLAKLAHRSCDISGTKNFLQIMKLQCYSPTKAMAYTAGASGNVSVKTNILDWIVKSDLGPQMVKRLESCARQISQSSSGSGTAGMRFEVRVPYHFAQDVFNTATIPLTTISECLSKLPSRDFWLASFLSPLRRLQCLQISDPNSSGLGKQTSSRPSPQWQSSTTEVASTIALHQAPS